MISDARLVEIARRLVTVDGMVSVLLGGSRARGTHTADSDVDLGLYYRFPLDVAALRLLAMEFAGPTAALTRLGEWGPWVDGGGWLTIDGTSVDWIYRDVDRLARSWSAAEAGRFELHFQVGHPFGVPDVAYAGEVALGRILADPSGALTQLHDQCRQLPEALGRAMVDRLWEAGFAVGNARTATRRQDVVYIAGCLFRVVLICAYALLGHARQWVVNEKGAISLAAGLPNAPSDFEQRCRHLLGQLGTTTVELEVSLAAAEQLITETRTACGLSPDDTENR